MMKQPFLAGLAGLAAAICAAGPAHAQTTAAAVGVTRAEATLGARQCAVPVRVARLDGELPRTVERLRAGGEFRIVAIGSSSTEGIGASSPDRSYPHQLQLELAKHFPASAIRVVNKGVGGEVASDMVARMQRDAVDLNPTLVIWQTGTNDAERGVPSEKFTATFNEGMAMLRRGGIDVLVVDPQYTPRVVDRGGYPVYFDLIARLSKFNGAALFRRQAVMRQWVDAGDFTFASMLASDRFHMNDRSYHCLASVLADAIAWSVRN